MSSTTLSAKETDMLAAILSLMGDLPKIDYDELGRRVGIAYGRNARASAKKLFDKIKGNVPTGANGAGSSANGNVGSSPAAKKAKTTPQKTSLRETPVKKTKIVKEESESEDGGNDVHVGQKRKAPVRRQASTKSQLKPENIEDSKFSSDDFGKFIASSVNNPAKTMDPILVSSSNTGRDKAGNSNFTPVMGYSEEEEKQDAADRGLTIEQWRQWRLDNGYDQLL